MQKLIHAIFRFWNRQLSLHPTVRIDPRAFLARGGPIHLGAGSVIRAGALLLPAGGSISLGRRCSVNQYSVINGQGGVLIGDDVMIAAFVSIFAANHVFAEPHRTISDQGMVAEGISVMDDVWIGTHCAVLDGVTIGAHSVVGAGSIVTKDIPSGSVACGVPARVVRRRA